MALHSVNRNRLKLAGVVSLVALGLSGYAAAQSPAEADAVRSAVQAAVDSTNTQAASLGDSEARSAYRSAMQSAITQSGARPAVVRLALRDVVCGGANRLEKEACGAELANLLSEVTQLAEADLNNGDVAAVRRALVAAVASVGGPPTTGGGGGGGGSTTGSNYQ